jgi:hypothetical protein
MRAHAWKPMKLQLKREALEKRNTAGNDLISRKKQKWCRRGESNPRPRDYETLALPLSYAGTGITSMLKVGSAQCQGVGAGGIENVYPNPRFGRM